VYAVISTTSPATNPVFRITLVPLVATKSLSVNLTPFTKTSTCPTVYDMEKVVCPLVAMYALVARALAVEIPEVPAVPAAPDDPDPPEVPDDPSCPVLPTILNDTQGWVNELVADPPR
jgi:hypothetical protein